MSGLCILPVTPERWPDLVAVMNGCSYGRKCWCAYWYLPNKDFKAGWGEKNRAVLETLVREGKEPGLIAYMDGVPAAWVSVAPRDNFDRLNRSRHFAPTDDLPVWAINCFVVAKRFQRQGLMRKLIEAAAAFAFAKGAPGVEGYPIAASGAWAASELYHGSIGAFADAGFSEAARPLPRRRIMRRMRAG